MNQVQISHPALVALQGRLRTISEQARPNTPESRARIVEREAEAAIAEIDQWLTDPAKQARDTAAMDEIHGLLSGKEWSADTLEQIAGTVEASGRAVQNYDG